MAGKGCKWPIKASASTPCGVIEPARKGCNLRCYAADMALHAIGETGGSGGPVSFGVHHRPTGSPTSTPAIAR